MWPWSKDNSIIYSFEEIRQMIAYIFPRLEKNKLSRQETKVADFQLIGRLNHWSSCLSLHEETNQSTHAEHVCFIYIYAYVKYDF